MVFSANALQASCPMAIGALDLSDDVIYEVDLEGKPDLSQPGGAPSAGARPRRFDWQAV